VRNISKDGKTFNLHEKALLAHFLPPLHQRPIDFQQSDRHQLPLGACPAFAFPLHRLRLVLPHLLPLLVVLVLDPVEAGGEDVIAALVDGVKIGGQGLLLLAGGGVLILLYVVELEEVSPAGRTLLLEVFLQVLPLFEASLELAEVLVLVDGELLHLGHLLALAVAQGFLVAHRLLEVEHADVHLGRGYSLLPMQTL
jgi:hypothetical protein